MMRFSLFFLFLCFVKKLQLRQENCEQNNIQKKISKSVQLRKENLPKAESCFASGKMSNKKTKLYISSITAPVLSLLNYLSFSASIFIT